MRHNNKSNNNKPLTDKPLTDEEYQEICKREKKHFSNMACTDREYEQLLKHWTIMKKTHQTNNNRQHANNNYKIYNSTTNTPIPNNNIYTNHTGTLQPASSNTSNNNIISTNNSTDAAYHYHPNSSPCQQNTAAQPEKKGSPIPYGKIFFSALFFVGLIAAAIGITILTHGAAPFLLGMMSVKEGIAFTTTGGGVSIASLGKLNSKKLKNAYRYLLLRFKGQDNTLPPGGPNNTPLLTNDTNQNKKQGDNPLKYNTQKTSTALRYDV